MTDRTKILLSVAGLVITTAVVFLQRSPAPESVTEAVAGATPERVSDGFSALSETPNKDNVSHDYRVRVARLRAQIEKEPNDSTALISLASLQQDAHKVAEAAANYERYLALNPESRQAWLDLANCYAQMKEWQKAEKTILRMLEHHSDDPAGMYNLGAVYANMGRTDEAVSWWKKTQKQQIDAELSSKAAAALIQISAAK